MIKIKHFLTSVALATLLASCCQEAEKDYVDYVNPYIGNVSQKNFSYILGKTTPGQVAIMPELEAVMKDCDKDTVFAVHIMAFEKDCTVDDLKIIKRCGGDFVFEIESVCGIVAVVCAPKLGNNLTLSVYPNAEELVDSNIYFCSRAYLSSVNTNSRIVEPAADDTESLVACPLVKSEGNIVAFKGEVVDVVDSICAAKFKNTVFAFKFSGYCGDTCKCLFINLTFVDAPKNDIAAARAEGAKIVVVHFRHIIMNK